MADKIVEKKAEKTALDISKLSFFDKAHIKEIEALNLKRVNKLLKERRSNRITAGLLVASVVSIYAYTIIGTRQETILDDLNEIEKVHD